MSKINFKQIRSELHEHSYFMKSYTAYGLLIFCSFFITAVILIYQISVYSLNNQQHTLKNSIKRAKELTEIASTWDMNINNSLYKIYVVNIMQIAEESNSIILVTDLEGNVGFYYDSNRPNIEKTTVVPYAIEKTIETGSYSEVGDLDDYFEDLSYIYGESVLDDNGAIIGVILMSMPATSIIYFILDLTQIFIMVTIFTLAITLFFSYFITSKTTYPLKQMSYASLKFAKGDFSTRVVENNNCIEIDNLAKSINYMAKSLEASEKKRNTFIENVSHELKTPMTSIGGFVDGILDGTIPEAKQEYYLKIISEEVKRLSRLTVRMLKTSRIQADTFTITKAPFDFCETVSRVIISFETSITQKNIDIEVDLEENVYVLGDRDNIHQVLYNLVENAIKFTKPNKKLKIALEIKKNDVYFEVLNECEEVEKEVLDNIFDRFYKIDKSRSEDTTGAGLGLYIVKKIINLHDGNINVEWKDGFMNFRFSLPLS